MDFRKKLPHDRCRDVVHPRTPRRPRKPRELARYLHDTLQEMEAANKAAVTKNRRCHKRLMLKLGSSHVLARRHDVNLGFKVPHWLGQSALYRFWIERSPHPLFILTSSLPVLDLHNVNRYSFDCSFLKFRNTAFPRACFNFNICQPARTSREAHSRF